MNRALILGNKNLSSWSLRPWLALQTAGVEFTEEVIRLDEVETTANMQRAVERHLGRKPEIPFANKVPVFIDHGVAIWESMAILEHTAERYAPNLWPSEPGARAMARVVSNEMHAGFAALRKNCPMWLKGTRSVEITPGAQADAARVQELWRGCLRAYGAPSKGGPFLFGAFSIADAMFAPVVTRFTTYGFDLDAECQAYADAVWALPAMQVWHAAALKER